ncbi:MAG: YihA family ribosome biogenesis GTP-binding protein [Oscillospiraceae bacterium]|nr:YihA family ribosome biogenesis GTP-binding protein [Oscillospiraceae bacterium]
MNLHNAVFVKSAATAGGFLKDTRPSIVFAGKSNVGKSSVINRLLNRKNFARVGASPGKTVHVNYFLIDEKAYFVDLPGYGYAKVSASERDRWAKLMESFFARPEGFALGVMIVDARHKPTENDVIMAQFFRDAGYPYLIVANKCDKLKRSEIEPNLSVIRATLELPDEIELIAFSAEKGTGREELLRRVETAAEQIDIQN